MNLFVKHHPHASGLQGALRARKTLEGGFAPDAATGPGGIGSWAPSGSAGCGAISTGAFARFAARRLHATELNLGTDGFAWAGAVAWLLWEGTGDQKLPCLVEDLP